MSQRVGATDDEAREGQARIERGTAERVMAGGNGRGGNRAQFQHRARIVPLGTARLDRRSCLLCRHRTTHRRSHGEVDAVHFRHFGLPGRQHALGVMGLDPALQKARWHRQMHAFILHGLEIHAREPAGIDVFPDARPQPALHPRPAILFCVCHCSNTFLKEEYSIVKSPCMFDAARRDLERNDFNLFRA